MSRPSTDEDLTPEQWAAQDERDAVETAEHAEAFHRFCDDAQEFFDEMADDYNSDVGLGTA